MLKADIAVVLALCAALASAIGAGSRQQSAHEGTDEPVGPWELIRMSLRDARGWFGGGGTASTKLATRRARRGGGRPWLRGGGVRAVVLCLDPGGVGRDDL